VPGCGHRTPCARGGAGSPTARSRLGLHVEHQCGVEDAGQGVADRHSSRTMVDDEAAQAASGGGVQRRR
jgi:hypothetical protein